MATLLYFDGRTENIIIPQGCYIEHYQDGIFDVVDSSNRVISCYHNVKGYSLDYQIQELIAVEEIRVEQNEQVVGARNETYDAPRYDDPLGNWRPVWEQGEQNG